jgi:glycosyltransferase involved in cell wall biosynthesis
MNKISIIIPVFNEVDTAFDFCCISKNSISKTIDYEIIIVDGGSIDGSQESFETRLPILISSEKRKSYTMNAGAESPLEQLYFCIVIVILLLILIYLFKTVQKRRISLAVSE